MCTDFEFPFDAIRCGSDVFGCYIPEEACDGILDCPNAFDEGVNGNLCVDAGGQVIDNTCQNGGTRLSGVPNFCDCPVRFTGDFCEIDLGNKI